MLDPSDKSSTRKSELFVNVERIKILINVVIYDMGILGIRHQVQFGKYCDDKRNLICYYQKFIIMSIFTSDMRLFTQKGISIDVP